MHLKKIYGSFLVLFVNKKIIADILIFFGFRIKYINILNRHLIEFELIKMINYSGLISPQKQSANILGGNIFARPDGTGVPSANTNVRYVYDGSDYTKFKKQQAVNRNYNDSSYGGDNNSSQVAISRVRH